LVILIFLGLNINFNLSHPTNHSQTLTNFTLNPPIFTFNVADLIPFTGGIDNEAETTNLRTNPSQEGGDDEMPRAKGPTTRAMARRIQEEWALNPHARPKMNFTWAKEDVKT